MKICIIIKKQKYIFFYFFFHKKREEIIKCFVLFVFGSFSALTLASGFSYKCIHITRATRLFFFLLHFLSFACFSSSFRSTCNGYRSCLYTCVLIKIENIYTDGELIFVGVHIPSFTQIL